MFTEGDAHRVNERLAAMLREREVEILAWYLCPHVPNDSCACRKPMPGMALAAARDCHLELPGSYVIGDTRADIELADAIGGTGILLTTGHGAEFAEWARVQARPVFGDMRRVVPEPELDDDHDEEQQNGRHQDRFDGFVAALVADESVGHGELVGMAFALAVTLVTMIAPAAMASAAKIATMITFSVTSPRSSSRAMSQRALKIGTSTEMKVSSFIGGSPFSGVRDR